MFLFKREFNFVDLVFDGVELYKIIEKKNLGMDFVVNLLSYVCLVFLYLFLVLI